MIDLLVQHFSISYGLLVVAIFYTIYVWIRERHRNREIAALGQRASQLKTWFYGLDFIYQGLKYARQRRNLDFWHSFFRRTNVDSQGNGAFTTEVTILGKLRIIFTADPENFKAILTSQFADYGKGEDFHKEIEPFLGDSIFATDGHKWQFGRSILRPMFARDRVVDVNLFEHHVQKLLPMLGVGNGSEVEITECFFRYTLDAATHYLLGTPVGNMDDERNSFAQWFGNIQRMQMLILRSGPLSRFLPKWSYYRDIRKLNAFLDPIITQALMLSPEQLDHNLKKEETFLHQLARSTRDRKIIRDQLVAILLAGRDTTACTLSWTFLELARHPEVTKKLRKEITERLGDRPPTYQDIKEMKYLTWVMNETLRRYPVVPINVRYSLTDTTLPRGGGPDGTLPVGIRKGTPVTYSPLFMQRRRDIYPPVSDAFPYHPDEWAPDRWATWTPKAWQYIPFNGGPRICIGQQFALVEMGYTICRILQHFNYVADLGGKDQEVLQNDIVLIPGEGVKVGFYRTNKEFST